MQDSQNALSEVLLERLQDIHAAAEPSWWPPAPGWWLLAGLGLLAVLFVLLAALRKLRRHLRRRRLIRELDRLAQQLDPRQQPAEYLAAISRWFRAIALRAFPDVDCARLQGEAWVEFIRARLPASLGPDGLDALVDGPYRPEPEFDAGALHARARQWVAAHG